ncbi:MAG: serine/threonine protein kinase [Bryobacteraceae bacterium]|nr:serine/threonine protein kinase [Bryobacteraceae bacterium]
MNDPLWQQAESLFHQALQLPEDQRGPFLDQACTGHPQLRPLLAQLLKAHHPAQRFDQPAPLASLAADWAQSQPQPQPSVAAGTRVGPWRLESRVGAGGMGEVFLASRDEGGFQQKAAVKLLLRALDSEPARLRFLRERQILARLEHPSVARLLDGGISAHGQPYLAMEFVDGIPLDQFCHQHNLLLRQRLLLFRQLCAAVSFAHANLIVHRDLKPANVLVNQRGEAKLLDFGIAKLLDDPLAPSQTAATQVLLTPRYASPEQVSADPVSTRSDVYALGVILFELLTQRSPYSSTQHTAAEWFRTIREEEPPPPSQASSFSWKRDLEGDLDAITAKALEKDPALRYPSVQQLDDDLERHLSGQPISARPHTAFYRLNRFVRRHRTGVAAASLAIFALLAGFGTALWQTRVAQAERATAERRFEQVRGLARLALFDLYDVVRDLPGGTQAQRTLITKTLEHYDRLANDARGDPALLTEVAEGYSRLGDLQGNPYTPNLGDSVEAIATYRRGLALLEPLQSPNAPPPTTLVLANLKRKLGEVLAGSGEAPAGLQSIRDAIALMASIEQNHLPAMAERCSTLGTLSDFLGSHATRETLDSAGMLRHAQESLDCWESLSRQPNLPEDLRARTNRALIIGEAKLAATAWADDRLDDAHKLLLSASARFSRLPPAEARSLSGRQLEVYIAQERAQLLNDMGRPAEALAIINSGIASARDLLNTDPGNIQFEVSLLSKIYLAGLIAQNLNNRNLALEHFTEARDRQQALLQRDPSNQSHQRRLDMVRTAMMNLNQP